MFVNRLIVFLFATDDSFDKLMKLPKEPFPMSCGDQLCLNVKHISASPFVKACEKPLKFFLC